MSVDKFDFQIRDELKMLPEFKSLQSSWNWGFISIALSNNVNKVKISIEMVIDMIVYCSKGDMDLAIKSLRTSKAFVDRCRQFLYCPLDGDWSDQIFLIASCQLLVQIWTQCFITTKCILEYGVDEAKLETSFHEVLDEVTVMINEIELVQIASGASGEEHHDVASTLIKLKWMEDLKKHIKERQDYFNDLYMLIKYFYEEN